MISHITNVSGPTVGQRSPKTGDVKISPFVVMFALVIKTLLLLRTFYSIFLFLLILTKVCACFSPRNKRSQKFNPFKGRAVKCYILPSKSNPPV